MAPLSADVVVWENPAVCADFVGCRPNDSRPDPRYQSSVAPWALQNRGRNPEFAPRRRTELAATTRFDPPHETPSVVQELAATGQVPAGAEPAQVARVPEQLRLQADQLGGHLARRQEDLDRREAELNSRIARLESEARAARLWLSQRESDLGSRSDALAKQQNEVAKQLEQLGATEAERKARLSALAAEKEDEMRRTLTSLAAQKNRLDEADSRLAAALAETQQLQQQLSRRRTAMAEETAALRDQIAAEHRQALADLEQKRQAVQRRAEHVDRCRAARATPRRIGAHAPRDPGNPPGDGGTLGTAFGPSTAGRPHTIAGRHPRSWPTSTARLSPN